ncbi:carboxypeptidase regulatory-like domain-containing protein, partial [candidate division KSB1 bacterium]
MDVVHRRKFRENLDWTQFVISPTILTSWNYPNYNLTLDNFWFNIDTNSLYASGTWNNDTNIKVLANYRLLPGTPVMKIKLWIINQNAFNLNAFLEYQIDPDETGEGKAYVPGVGWGNTIVNNGWNKNYVYNGVDQGYHSNNPAHGIAWLMNTPEALITPGYIFGVWFNVNTNAGDTTEIALYHITDIPDDNNVPNYYCIEKWSDTIIYIDPELSNYTQISGVVEDVYNNPVPGISILIKDINGNVDGKTTTDSNGNYKIFLEKGLYTFTVSGIGYALQSRSIDSNIDSILDFTNAFSAALQAVTVWAGFGKTLKNGIIQGTETDMVMENNELAVSIANTSIDGQLSYSSRGRPLDLAVHGVEDDLDWIHLSFASKSKPTGTEAWQYESIIYDTIYVYQLNQNKAIVKTNGHYFELQGVNNDSVVIFNNIPVSTTYTIEPGNKYIYTETIIANNTASTESFWMGDVIDYDGTGQVSYVPGSGIIDSGYSSPATYQPSLPWIAMYGNSPQAYGFIYEDDFANQFEAYGNGSWIMSIDSASINPGTSYQYNRYLVAASTNGYPNKADAIQNIYNQLISQQTGISTDLTLSKHYLQYNDTLLASLTITNSLNQPSMALNVNVDIPKQLTANAPTSLTIGYIPANSDTTLNWILTGISGGRGFMQCYISDTGNNTITEYESIFVNAGGWFAGDNHMHTTYSDGIGSVADNVASAYQKGLSWVTITDHNTINQANDVNTENAKYDDFLVMFGEEVTTSPSHFLAYNITQLSPWNTSQYTYQQLIDSVLFQNNGNGIVYIAHPY